MSDEAFLERLEYLVDSGKLRALVADGKY